MSYSLDESIQTVRKHETKAWGWRQQNPQISFLQRTDS